MFLAFKAYITKDLTERDGRLLVLVLVLRQVLLDEDEDKD